MANRTSAYNAIRRQIHTRPTIYRKHSRAVWLYLGSILLWIVLLMLVLRLSFPMPSGSRPTAFTPGPLFWSLVAVGLVLIVGGSLMLLALRTRLDAARKAEHRLACPWCGFDLSRSAPSGLCPECAAAYEHEAVRRYWEGIGEMFTRYKRANLFPSDRAILRQSGLATRRSHRSD